MRWKIPNNGDKRIVKRFALFPIRIDNECRWLEFVYIQQFYDDFYNPYPWRNECFVDHE